MNKYKAMIAGVAVLAVPALCSAAPVTLTAGDASGTSSMNSAGNWSDGLAPAPANDYYVATKWLRSPGSGDVVFGGNSLTLQSGGAILNKNVGAQTLTSNLILDGGYVRSGAGPSDPFTLAGTINVASTGGLIPDQSPYVISASVTGSGTLILANDDAAVGGTGSGPGRGIDFTGLSTFTGEVTANAADMVWMNGSSWSFSIGVSGVNNAISGTGDATFDGAFALDLTGAGTTIGDSWSLASVAGQTFGANFTVAGFADQGDGTWYLNNGAEYSFDTATGALSVIPEPATLGMIGFVGACMLFVRRRFMI